MDDDGDDDFYIFCETFALRLFELNNNNNGSCLVCRYVIHTVGPRYNIKYKTAAESALFSSYRSVMKIVRFVSLLVFVIFWETAIVHVHVTVRSGQVKCTLTPPPPQGCY